MSPPLFFLHSDAKVLDQIRKGDEEGLVTLYRQNRRIVMSYVVRNNGTKDDAEDMLQEALIVLWERVRSGRYEYSAKISTFIFATVKNQWSRRLVKSRREIPQELTTDEHPDDDPSTLETLVNDERTSLVRKAMGKLGDQCRKLLILFYWDEFSMEQIAAEMAFANAETAKSKKYQCKKELERIMRGLGLE